MGFELKYVGYLSFSDWQGQKKIRHWEVHNTHKLIVKTDTVLEHIWSFSSWLLLLLKGKGKLLCWCHFWWRTQSQWEIPSSCLKVMNFLNTKSMWYFLMLIWIIIHVILTITGLFKLLFKAIDIKSSELFIFYTSKNQGMAFFT